MEGQIVRHGAVRLPDGAEAGRLRCHHIDADAVVHGQAGHGGPGKFQHLILHEAVFVHRAAQGDGHVVAEFPVPDINLYAIETNGHGRRAPDGFHDDSLIPGYHLISSE